MQLKKKRILIVNCYFDELRIPIQRQTKIPQSMAPAFLAGLFEPELCEIRLYDEVYSGPLEDERLLSFPHMLVLTGLNTAFDRMLHITAYVKTKNSRAVVVAGGAAIRALPTYAENFFDYCCTGDIEQLRDVIEEAFGKAYVSTAFLETGWVIPRFDLAYWMSIMTYVESSRNCYFRCSYCSLTAEQAKYRIYDLEYVRRQFLALGKRRMVHFLDNNFASCHNQFVRDRFDLLQKLRDAGHFHGYGAEVTSDFFLQEENLALAYQSGCMALFSGVESFDTKTLVRFKKYQNTCLPQVDMIRRCLDAGIIFLYGIIFDLTTRRIAELKQELDFIIGTHEITLPAFITLAIPLLKSPFFYECLRNNLFLPNLKLRDLDGTTISLKPKDSLGDAVAFLKSIQGLRGYKQRILQHMTGFFKRYRKALNWERMGVAQYNGFLLCTPGLSTVGSAFGSGFRRRLKNPPRTFIGSTEPLDAVYRPAFTIDSSYRRYFEPTMLTDHKGQLVEALQADLQAD